MFQQGVRRQRICSHLALDDGEAHRDVGEVAAIEGRCYGLVGPGYTSAEVVADRLLGGEAEFPEADMSTKLKLLGVDVASFGDAMGATPDCLEVVVNDAVNQTYAKLVLSDDAKTLLGGILVGDASAYGILRPMVGEPLPGDPLALIAPAGSDGGGAGLGVGALPDGAQICSCNNVTKGDLTDAIAGGCCDVPAPQELHPGGHLLRLVRAAAQAAARGRGRRAVQGAVRALRPVTGRAVRDRRRDRRSGRSPDLIERFGTGKGCDICKPVGRVDPRVDELRAHPRRRAGLAAGHQRPLPGQHPEATAPTRSCRGCPAARSRPSS